MPKPSGSTSTRRHITERLENDYRQLALDAAMATAAAPTYLKPHLTADEVELVDGGVWANNPVVGIAAVEAIGILGWPRERLKILSIGTTADIAPRPRWGGLLPLGVSGYGVRLLMAGQSCSAMGMAKIITGGGNQRQAIWRIDQIAPEGRYSLDNTARIRELKDRAYMEARHHLAELRQEFFHGPAEPFVPIYRLETQT
jgi:hypothetical protein